MYAKTMLSEKDAVAQVLSLLVGSGHLGRDAVLVLSGKALHDDLNMERRRNDEDK